MNSTLPRELFDRVDNAPDSEFYQLPRFVNHIDDATIDALTAYYERAIPESSSVLDLMSSWVSHLPPEREFDRVSGLGMNQAELAANPRLDEYAVHDLNADPGLPFDEATFDFALIAVSIQYLVRPLEVFEQVARVLRPGGSLIVAMSHRCFPTKAIRAFHAATMTQRAHLVAHYFDCVNQFNQAEIVDCSPENADPLVIVRAAKVS